MTPAQVVTALHAADPIASALGVDLIGVEADRIVLGLKIDSAHVGENGVCHGGVLFTLADIAMAYLSNRDNVAAVATAASIDFVEGVVNGEVVEAIATETNRRGRAAICDVTLSVGDRTVAVFRGNTLRTQGRAVGDD